MLIMRKFEFDAAHRVLNHESKCKYIHGHRYVAEVYVSAPELDTIGRVIDFGIVKDRIGTWINDTWDHNILLNPEDPLAKLWRTTYGHSPSSAKLKYCLQVFDGNEPFIMKAGRNPTAENIAKELHEIAIPLVPEVTVEKVRIWETPNCFAEYTGTSR